MTTVVIPARFSGPPTSANGGWAAGTLARFVGDAAVVTLKSPPPLDTEMSVVATEVGYELRHGDTLVAEARLATGIAAELPMPVTLDEATEASTRFAWRDTHPYPTCFVCGPARGDDGLRICPGAVDGRRVAAAAFRVPPDLCADGVTRAELLWAALDCPSWFGHGAFYDDHGLVLLGRLEGEIRRRPGSGERCVAAGWPISRDGRKIHTGSVVWSGDGEVLAAALATWIELKR